MRNIGEGTGFYPEDGVPEEGHIIGGYIAEADPPTGTGIFHFEPAPNVLECDAFDTTDSLSLTVRLTNIFGAFEYVPVGKNRWDVESPSGQMGTVIGGAFA